MATKNVPPHSTTISLVVYGSSAQYDIIGEQFIRYENSLINLHWIKRIELVVVQVNCINNFIQCPTCWLPAFERVCEEAHIIKLQEANSRSGGDSSRNDIFHNVYEGTDLYKHFFEDTMIEKAHRCGFFYCV